MTGLFIAGFTMADNQSAWPHVQLLLLVIAIVVAISFVEAVSSDSYGNGAHDSIRYPNVHFPPIADIACSNFISSGPGLADLPEGVSEPIG